MWGDEARVHHTCEGSEVGEWSELLCCGRHAGHTALRCARHAGNTVMVCEGCCGANEVRTMLVCGSMPRSPSLRGAVPG